jgi:very-short-patch-repair endonuclease
MNCLDAENALAAMESAIRRGFLSEKHVRELGALAPRRLRPLIPSLITNSGSGNETIARVRLMEAGYHVIAQARVPGVGHQDLLVDNSVAIEVDSSEWHDDETQQALDIERDLVSVGLGRPVLRIRPTHIRDSWPSTLAVIDRAVRDARSDTKRG